MPFTPASAALDHFTVLDLTRARAGPTAARQLADFGADVIKIEAPGDPNYADSGTRFGPDFQNLHRNKRSLTLDLKSEEGHTVFMKLAADADVIVENYRPDVKNRLKIAYEDVRAVNKGIVYASISGFGQTGPYANRPGLDQIAQGMGGHMSVTGKPGEGPVRSGAAISDMTAGFLTAGGIMAALLERQKSDEGQWLHTSLLQAQIFLLDFQAARWTVDGDVPPQEGNNHPTFVPMGTFKTEDGYVNLAPMESMWSKFCHALRLADMENDEKFATGDARFQNRQEVDARIEEVTLTKSTAHWVELLNEAGIPCGPIYKLDEVFEDEQVKHLGVAQTVEAPGRGETTILGQPVTLDRTPSKLAAGSPRLGQHVDEILAGIGYTVEEIDGLREKGVV